MTLSYDGAVDTNIIQRFFQKVDKSGGPSACWNWIGSNDYSYGTFKFKNKSVKAHRFSFELMYGDMINKNEMICHHCDNPLCVNPLHLFLGNRSDNMKDMLRKNRGNRPFGSSHWKTKLSENDVMKIKYLIDKNIKLIDIAKKFNTTHDVISMIRRKKTWKHL